MDGYMLRMLMEGSPEGRERFHEFMESKSRGSRRHRDELNEFFEEEYPRRMRREHSGDFEERFRRMFDNMDRREKKSMWESMMGSHQEEAGGHFSPVFAKKEVSDMYHIENGSKHKGEKYSMDKAEEVYKRYKTIIPSDITIADVYVAINSQYHDYASLFKAWFGNDIDTKIIESAIVFWFKDEDYPDNDKLWDYFKELM